MAADPEMWKAFLAWSERAISDREAQLALLRAGTLRAGERSPETGGAWVDTTDAQILRLENEIASIKTVIARHQVTRNLPPDGMVQRRIGL